MSKNHTITDLLDIMVKLRTPETGCPWDLEQTFSSIAPYTIEEAYEVDEPIRQNDMPSLKDELGDLLFQVVFHSQMAKEQNVFEFSDVVQSISDKMIRRHPHVFDNQNGDSLTGSWEEMKSQERKAKATKEGKGASSVLDGVSLSLPALQRAVKLQNRAARVGFDWPETSQVIEKIEEESQELLDEVNSGVSQDKIKEEYGDLLFVISNLGRHLDLDPEECLREANVKFTRRFNGVETKLSEIGKTPQQSTLEEMDEMWNEVKIEEKA